MGRVISSVRPGESMFKAEVQVYDLIVNLPRPKLRHGISLRESWKRKLLALPPSERHKTCQRVAIKRQSKGLKAEQAKYRKVSASFLARPENQWCICCTLRREKLGENILRNQSTEIHHWAGRIGRLLCYVPYFRAFCYHCRTWPHEHPSLARDLNLLAPPAQWNVLPANRDLAPT